MAVRNGATDFTRDCDPYNFIQDLELPQYVYENLVQQVHPATSGPMYEVPSEQNPFGFSTNNTLQNLQPHVRNKQTYSNLLTVPQYEMSTSMADTPPISTQSYVSFPGSGYDDDNCCDNAISSTMMNDSGTPYDNMQNSYQMNMDGYNTTSTSSPNSQQRGKKRKSIGFNSNEAASIQYDMSISGAASGCDAGSSSNTMSSQASKKRNGSSFNGSGYEDEASDATSGALHSGRKHNHSQIEKRRRDKMNNHINELGALVPMCRAMARKLDKLTVLRMAVQHLRTVRGSISAGPTASPPRPAFISERELNSLLLQVAEDCFLMVIGCDRGRLLYVSNSVTRLLHYSQAELLGQSVFDIIHPKDITKVKEQLSSAVLSPREKLVDAKTMLPIKSEVVSDSRLCTGARRSFFCRIKSKYPVPNVKMESNSFSDVKSMYSERRYCVVHCSGYLKSWCPSDISDNIEELNDLTSEDSEANVTCLVAVGRALQDVVTLPQEIDPDVVSPSALGFTSRHTVDGKFVYVDQRCTLVLGYLPQEMMGTSLYEYVKEPELSQISQNHRGSLAQVKPVLTVPYSFKRKDGVMILLQTIIKSFRNPWNKDVEYIVANNFYIKSSKQIMSNLPAKYDTEDDSEAEIKNLVETQLKSQKLSKILTDDAKLRKVSPAPSPGPSTPPAPPEPITFLNFQQIPLEPLLDDGLGTNYTQIRNNVPLISTRPPSPLFEMSSNSDAYHSTPASSSPSFSGVDGDGEADMATVMSLLEADAGICPPLDVSSLPWEGI